MAMQEALIARLKAAVGIVAIIDGDMRISFFGRVREAALPALTLQTITNTDGWSHQGPTGLDQVRVQFDCWAATRPAALALARAVRAEMQEARDQDGVRFHPGRRDSERMFDEGEQGGGAVLFRVSQDFLFYHEEI